MKIQFIMAVLFSFSIILSAQKDNVVSTGSADIDFLATPAKFEKEIVLNESTGDMRLMYKVSSSGNVPFPWFMQHYVLKDSFLSDDNYRKSIDSLTGKYLTLSASNLKKLPDPFVSSVIWTGDGVGRQSGNRFRSFFFQFKRFSSRLYGVDSSSSVFSKGELLCYSNKIWNSENWIFADYEFSRQKRPMIITPEFPFFYYQNYTIPSDYRMLLDNWKILNLDLSRYKRFEIARKDCDIRDSATGMVYRYLKERSNMSPDKTETDSFFRLLKESGINVPHFVGSNRERDSQGRFLPIEKYFIPLLLVDPDNHANRTDKNDWAVSCFINWKNGSFYQTFSFSKEKLYSRALGCRDILKDHCGGVTKCHQSTVGVVLDDKRKVVILDGGQSLTTNSLVFSLSSLRKAWRPVPIPKDLKNISPDSVLFFYKDGLSFGSWCPIWELDIWYAIGNRLKQNPEAEVYLCGYGTLLQAAETKTVEEEHALIKKCGVKITPMMYQSLELMRKKQQQGN